MFDFCNYILLEPRTRSCASLHPPKENRHTHPATFQPTPTDAQSSSAYKKISTTPISWQSVTSIITEAKMLLQEHRINRVLTTRRFLGCKITHLVPISTLMQLTVSYCEIAKYIKRSPVGTAYHRLLHDKPDIHRNSNSMVERDLPGAEYQSSVRYAWTGSTCKAFPPQPPSTIFEGCAIHLNPVF